ncbi:MFS transporter [Streptomyces sp. NBC_00199]|uniref:MFS transporter n=1 Tax=Streptomyces sp. NBC_00199 TaxID=2975678 RepID=UPI00224FF038|nr:MFS transporter [Streptomyces sp. NBC_00199]MCX5265950.1 MFS transporter [Streptomyces sp. NBC_00199]
MSGATTVRDTEAVAPRMGRPFAWLFHACAGSNLADGIYQVALPIAAVHIGGDASGVAVVTAAARTPWLLFGLFSGVLVDRLDQRRLMWLVSMGRALVLGAATALFLTDTATVPALAAIAFLLGVGETIFDTAFHTTTPQLVQKSLLERANARLQAAEITTNQLLGPPLGGMLLGIAAAFAFGATAVLYAAVMLAVLAIPRQRRRPTPPQAARSVRRDLTAGLLFLVRHPSLLIYAIGVGLLNLAWAAVYTTLPLFALAPGPLGLSSAAYGVVLMLAGVSGLVTGLASAKIITSIGPRSSLVLGLTGLALGLGLPGLWPTRVGLAVGLACTGLLILINVVTVTHRQRTVPIELLGRVTSAYRLIAFGCLPVGSALAGVVGTHFGSRSVLSGAGLLVVATAVPMILTTKNPSPATPAAREQP